MKDHTESIQLDFDPSVISYQQLLKLALAQGSFGGSQWSRQYRSVVFYHNDAQRLAATQLGIAELEPFGFFTRAEDYHQKYYLQQSSVAEDFYTRYPDAASFTDSTTVARANGTVGGHIELARLRRLVPQFGVSKTSQEALYRMAGKAGPGCTVPRSNL